MQKQSILVDRIETLACDAGWRNYYFLKITTNDGIVGWSQYDEGFGSPGVSTVIEQLAPVVVGTDIANHERFFTDAYCRTRPATGGINSEAIGAIENALLDAKAKSLGIPCYDLLGGKLRDRIRVYWSHCPTWRINHPAYYGPAITDLDGVKKMGEIARESQFTALKTNWFNHAKAPLQAWRPGFSSPFYPELNVDKTAIKNLVDHLGALRDGAGPDMDILIDLNFNAKTEGYLKILKAIEDFDIFWVEIDSYNPDALAFIRSKSPHPISSCETLFGGRELLPFLQKNAVDVAIIDAVWNGVWQSMKMANLADIHDVNIAPHNFYGHLSTFMNAHFAAAVPNLRIMETDIDRIAWENELFTHAPEYQDGHMLIPNRPGWGTDPIEEAIKAYPPKMGGGLLKPLVK